MNEYTENVGFTPEAPRDVPVKWLRALFYTHIVSLVFSVISILPVSGQWITWFSRAITISSIGCLFQLAPACGRYRKAAIFRTVFHLGTWINSLLLSSTALMLAASICSLIAVYQEYSAHSEITADQDPKLSRKWHSLFNWSIAAGILISFGSVIVSVVSVMIGMDMAAVVSIVMAILSLPELIVEIFYLVYLNRTIQLLQK